MTLIDRPVRRYLQKIRLFRRNVRLLLLSLALSGIAFGVYSLLFNFYILGLGFNEAQLGRLLTTHSTALFLGAVPAGAIADRLGRKRSLLISSLAVGLVIFGLSTWTTTTGLTILMGGMGLAQSLAVVTLPAFLMENSGEEERTYLFSFSASLQMLIGMLGFWLGGRLPGWLARGTAEAPIYSLILIAVAITVVCATIPLLFLHETTVLHPRNSIPDLLRYARQHLSRLGKFITPVLLTALGAGLFVPFMNLFFRSRHGTGDAAIGSLFAAGSLAIGLGFLLAPPLAERLGKIRLVIATQVLFIPVLALLGFSPTFWLSAAAYLMRVVLMTMDDPIYQAFVMEEVEEGARASVNSLLTMASSLGWAVGPAISGRLQAAYGFSPVFLIVILLYVAAICLTRRFFLNRRHPGERLETVPTV